jgi:hypothetical protein
MRRDSFPPGVQCGSTLDLLFPTQVMSRAKRAAAGPTVTRDWMLLNESEGCGGVVDSGNPLVFAEIDGENIAGGRGRGASCVGAKVHADRDTLRLAHPTACLDSFGRRREPCEHPVVQGR